MANRGTLLLTTGGDGTRWYRASPPTVGKMLDALVAEGFSTAELAWDAPGVWASPGGGIGPRTEACRFATAARWVYDTLHQGGSGALFIAQGTSGGGAQIALGLAYYGLSEVLRLALLGGGPPGCPLCAVREQFFEAMLTGTPLLTYPNTTVRFFVGDADPNAGTVAEGKAYYDAITSGKSYVVVPSTAHDVEFSDQGQKALVDALHAAATAGR